MDAGCDYHGYMSDITRTWPVDGKFTAAQKDLYEIVLAVKDASIKVPFLRSLLSSMNTIFSFSP